MFTAAVHWFTDPHINMFLQFQPPVFHHKGILAISQAFEMLVFHKMQREQRTRCFSLSGSAKECHKTPPESYFTFTRYLFYNILTINTTLFHQWHPACFWNNLVIVMFLTHCSYLHTFNLLAVKMTPERHWHVLYIPQSVVSFKKALLVSTWTHILDAV